MLRPTPFISLFEKTAGVIPSIISSTAVRQRPFIVTRSIDKLADGITKVELDIGVPDIPSSVQHPYEKTLEEGWGKLEELHAEVPDANVSPTKPPSPIQSTEHVQGDRLSLDFVPCILLLPPNPPSRRSLPAMLCLHQTTTPASLGKLEPTTPHSSLSYAYDLTSRGYVTITPDYPFYGNYAPSLASIYSTYQSVTMKAIVNHVHAVDLLIHHPLVDPQRIGAIGHSLGGTCALFAALCDTRLTCVVSSAGFSSFESYTRSRWFCAGAPPTHEELASNTAYYGDIRGWSRREKYMPLIDSEFGNDWRRVPWGWGGLIGALAPRGVFASSPQGDLIFPCDGARESVAEARKEYEMNGTTNVDEALVAVYPYAEHEFPEETKKMAYEWLDRRMKVRN